VRIRVISISLGPALAGTMVVLITTGMLLRQAVQALSWSSLFDLSK